jgi:hypothetical protein
MTHSRRVFLAASASLMAARRAHAEAPHSDLLARIARARAPVRTLQGPFVQIRTIGLLATDVRSTGTLTLLRPDRLRWELGPPDDVIFWVVPEGLAYRTARSQGRVPAAAARFERSLDDLRVLLAGDLGRLSERWDMRVVRDDDTGAELEAVPHQGGAAGSLQSLRFALDPDLIRPKRAILIESPRDKTVIEFGPLTVNAPVDESLLRAPA